MFNSRPLTLESAALTCPRLSNLGKPMSISSCLHHNHIHIITFHVQWCYHFCAGRGQAKRSDPCTWGGRLGRSSVPTQIVRRMTEIAFRPLGCFLSRIPGTKWGMFGTTVVISGPVVPMYLILSEVFCPNLQNTHGKIFYWYRMCTGFLHVYRLFLWRSQKLTGSHETLFWFANFATDCYFY